jgi:uncharacterized membrane protein YkoI
MRKNKMLFAAFAASLLGGSAFAGKDVTLDQVPEKVRTAVQKEVGTGQLEDIERETVGGRAMYEVEYERDKAEWEVMIDEDGKVISRRPD